MWRKAATPGSPKLSKATRECGEKSQRKVRQNSRHQSESMGKSSSPHCPQNGSYTHVTLRTKSSHTAPEPPKATREYGEKSAKAGSPELPKTTRECGENQLIQGLQNSRKERHRQVRQSTRKQRGSVTKSRNARLARIPDIKVRVWGKAAAALFQNRLATRVCGKNQQRQARQNYRKQGDSVGKSN